MRVAHILYTLFLSVMLSSCTLMMDDLELELEEMGFDEPVVEQTQFGNVTYQYNEGVHPITSNVQEYLVAVQDDNTLYFMDNLPEKWQLQPGDLLAAGCSRKLPGGLNHRVVSVERTGGLIKVVTTPATRNEIYKELNIRLDFDYTAPETYAYDPEEYEEKGLNPDDEAITDFSLIDGADDAENGITRAEGEKKDTTLVIKPSLEFPKFKKIVDFGISATITHQVIQHIYYEERKEDDYKENWTEDRSVTTFDVEIRAGKAFPKGTSLNSLDNTREVTKLLKEMKAQDPNAQESKSFKFLKVTVPIPCAVPISAFLEFDATVTFNVAAIGHVVITHHHPWKRSGYIYNKGEKTEIDGKPTREGDTEISQAGIIGECSVKGNVRVGLGIELTGVGIGSSLGIALKPGLEFKYPMEWCNDTTGIDREGSYLKFYVDLVADASIFFAPGGQKLASASVEIAKKNLYTATTHFSPKIDPDYCSHTYKSVWDENQKKHVTNYDVGINFEKLYTFNDYWHKMSTFPRLRVYHGTLDGKFIELRTSGNDKTVTREQIAEAGKTYHFNFTQDQLLSQEQTYVCVPCLYDYIDKKSTEFREHTFTYGEAKPKVEYKRYKQGYGKDLTEYLSELSPEKAEAFKQRYNLKAYPSSMLKKLAFYNFCVDFKVTNIAFQRSWGIHVELIYGNNKNNVIVDKDIEVASNDLHSATYSLVLEFISNLKIEDNEKCIAVRFRPYTINRMGQRKDHALSKWYDIFYPYYNEDYMGNGERITLNVN